MSYRLFIFIGVIAAGLVLTAFLTGTRLFEGGENGGGEGVVLLPDGEDKVEREGDGSSVPSAAADGTDGAGGRSYLDPRGRFSFTYPAGFRVSSFSDDGGETETVLVQNVVLGRGFQVVISKPEAVPDRLTVGILKESAPSLAISDAQEFTIGSAGGGLVFSSNNELFGGGAREAWFVYKGELYQISAFVKDKELVDNTAKSWRFLR